MNTLQNQNDELTNVCDYCRLAHHCPENPEDLHCVECDTIDLIEDEFIRYTNLAYEEFEI